MTRYIDLNCDMGESYGRWTLGNDAEVMPQLTSANLACGFHAGDPHIMRSTVELAIQHGVAIGADPGLPDLMGFGRRALNVSAERAQGLHPLSDRRALEAFATVAGAELQHVKPHGIQYTMFVRNLDLARACAEAVAELDEKLILMTMADTKFDAAARATVVRHRRRRLRRPPIHPRARAGLAAHGDHRSGSRRRAGGHDGQGGSRPNPRRRRRRRERSDHLRPRRHAQAPRRSSPRCAPSSNKRASSSNPYATGSADRVGARYFGASVPRREDARLLRGEGQFVDIVRPGLLHAAFVRSPHAHARLTAIDVQPALAVDGVVAAFTAVSFERWLKPLPLFGVSRPCSRTGRDHHALGAAAAPGTRRRSLCRRVRRRRRRGQPPRGRKRRRRRRGHVRASTARGRHVDRRCV